MIAKKLYLTIVLLAVLTIPVVQLPSVSAVDSPADTNQVLVFLRDVLGLDMDKYEVSLRTQSPRNYSDISIIGDIGYIETSGSYTLQYWDTEKSTYSLLHSNFIFADKILIYCSLEVDSGENVYSQPLPINVADAAETFMQRYEAFNRDTELTSMQNLLLNVEGTKNLTKTADNIELRVSVTSFSTSFQWKQVYNGVEYSGLGVSFRDGAFHSFVDDRCIYTIGKTDVNISKEQAIEIALKQGEAYSYSYDGKAIANFSIVKDQILTELHTRSRFTINELYPFYTIYLPLGNQYPGYVSVIRVELWADNGELISCQALSYGGPLLGNNTSGNNFSPSPSPIPETPTSIIDDQTQNNLTTSLAVYIAIATFAVLIPVIALAVLVKRRSK